MKSFSKKPFFVLAALSMMLVASCDSSNNPKPSVQTFPTVAKKSGARVTPGYSAPMIGTWRMAHYYAATQNPSIVFAGDDNTACQFKYVYLTVTSNGNGGGSMSISNGASCFSTTFQNMISDTNAGGRQLETASIPNSVIQWQENTYLDYNQIGVGRSSSSESGGVSRGWRLSFNSSGQAMYWNQDGSGDQSREIAWTRQ